MPSSFWENTLICSRGMGRTREPDPRREPKGDATGSPERRYQPTGGYRFRFKSKNWMALVGATALPFIFPN